MEICTVGGYDDVGANMTAVKIGDDVVIFDMGISVEKYIQYTNDDDVFDISIKQMISSGSVPDIRQIDDWKDKVKAIAITHAHLDHCAAIPFLAKKFNAPIYCTPYTAEIIKTMLRDDKLKIPNEIKILNPNSMIKINNKLKLEFINVTHSVPQAVVIALHSSEGSVLYANDFKLDSAPIIGKKTNLKRLKELDNVKCLILDSLYSNRDGKTPSEPIAHELLRDVMLGFEGRAMIVTTFSSHIARLKTIIQLGKETKRKVVFLGRSLNKYVEAAENIDLVNFTKEIELVKYRRDINRAIRRLFNEGIDKYLLVVTGHQGEPKAVLSRIANSTIGKHLGKDDMVIFSCTVIPTKVNIQNREKLEESLKDHGVRIHKNLHVSGHASREDIRDFIKIINPKHIIPAHGGPDIRNGLTSLAEEMGFAENYHMMGNGNRLKLH